MLHVLLQHFPLWWLVLPPSHLFVVGLWVLSHGAMPLQESIETYSSPACGGSPAQPDRGRRIGGGERSEPISRMFFMPYDTEKQIP